MNIVSKITLKTIGCQPTPHSVKPNEHIDLAHIIGYANSAEVKRSGFDQDYTVFSGNFEGIALATGEIYRSGKLILPAVVQNLLAPAVAAAQDQPVAIAVSVGAEYSEKGSTGYAYTAHPLIEPTESDPLETLRIEAKKSLQLQHDKSPKSKK